MCAQLHGINWTRNTACCARSQCNRYTSKQDVTKDKFVCQVEIGEDKHVYLWKIWVSLTDRMQRYPHTGYTTVSAMALCVVPVILCSTCQACRLQIAVGNVCTLQSPNLFYTSQNTNLIPWLLDLGCIFYSKTRF